MLISNMLTDEFYYRGCKSGSSATEVDSKFLIGMRKLGSEFLILRYQLTIP